MPAVVVSAGGERVATGVQKTCSLCGATKDTAEFGPKKGSRDGKDCYCRICSTLRRRYSIPVRPSKFCEVDAAGDVVRIRKGRGRGGSVTSLTRGAQSLPVFENWADSSTTAGSGERALWAHMGSLAACMQVVRAAVENGTLHQLLGPGKPRSTFSHGDLPSRAPSRPPLAGGQVNTMPPLGNIPPPVSTTATGVPVATVVGAAGALVAANGGAADVKSAPCVLCEVVKMKEDIAMFVAGDAFCVPCDRLRRRANNLGLGYGVFVSDVNAWMFFIQ